MYNTRDMNVSRGLGYDDGIKDMVISLAVFVVMVAFVYLICAITVGI
jgi:hypothetical protein